MKRILSLLLAFSLSIALYGCGKNSITDSASFYYQRANFLYESENGAIAPETRDITGHAEDLSYLISLYLMGPLDDGLQSPFPAGYRLEDVMHSDAELIIHLSGAESNLSHSQFSLACGCLALTCLELTHAESVTIICGELSQTLTADSLTLYDNVTAKETTNGGTK